MTNDANERTPFKLGGLGAYLPHETQARYSDSVSQQPTAVQVAPPSLPGWASGREPALSFPKNDGGKVPALKNILRPKSIALVLGGLCLCAIALAIWLTTRGVSDVTLYQVGNQNVTHTIGGGGIVFPYQQLSISYPSTERVVAVLVKPGDTVTLNQPLLKLDPTQLSAQITQASNDVSAAQAYLNSVSSGGNAIAIAQAQQSYELAKNKYNALVAQTSSTILHSGNLIAPLAGVVTAVNINAGEVFSANTSLVTIMDESKVVVRVKIPLINLQQIQVGQSATVTPSALPNVNLSGAVSAVIPRADPQTDTFEVWIEIINTNGTLLPGMSAFARIQAKSAALTVPRLALLNVDRESIVFVANNGHVHIARVQVIGQSGSSMLVSKGLRSGDRVVVVGNDTLRDGQAVRIRGVERA